MKDRQKLIHTFGALAELSQEVANKQNFQDMIRTSLHLVLGSLAIMRGGVARYSRFGSELNMLVVRNLGENFPLCFSLCSEDERQFLTNGLAVIEVKQARVLPFFQVYDQSFESKKIELLVPLVIRDELVGVLFLGEKANGEPFTSYDKEIICAMAQHIGGAISQRNLMIELERRAAEHKTLFEDLNLTYRDTVKAFAAAIDSKDKYTEGHSERVGKYAEIIASELGYSEEHTAGVAVAGYLHDVGKLVVDRSIINSTQRISASEHEQLSLHPKIGYEILAPIRHPYAEVPLAARHHHERIDGRGYPDKLSDKQIPYIGKIVCLADSFDAMTSDRSYRRRRYSDEVIDDLWRNSGKQFAPEIVAAFFRGMLKELTGETKEKRFSIILGKDYLQPEKCVPLLKYALNSLDGTTSLTSISSE